MKHLFIIREFGYVLTHDFRHLVCSLTSPVLKNQILNCANNQIRLMICSSHHKAPRLKRTPGWAFQDFRKFWGEILWRPYPVESFRKRLIFWTHPHSSLQQSAVPDAQDRQNGNIWWTMKFLTLFYIGWILSMISYYPVYLWYLRLTMVINMYIP